MKIHFKLWRYEIRRNIYGMLNIKFKIKQNHNIHTDIKWTEVKDFFNSLIRKLVRCYIQFKGESKYRKFIDQEYWNECANRSKTGFSHSAKGNQLNLYQTEFIFMSIDYRNLHFYILSAI